MKFARDGSVAQGEEIDLTVAREHQARIKKTINSRTLIGVAAVEWKTLGPQPGHGTHNAVRLENADVTIWAECSWHSTERLRLEKCAGFVQLAIGETDPTGAFRRGQYVGRQISDRSGVEIPEPLRQFAR